MPKASGAAPLRRRRGRRGRRADPIRQIRRLESAEVHEIARELVTGQGFIAFGPPRLDAFYLMLTFVRFAPDVHNRVGALYARYADGVIPGRAYNGFPIFLTVQFLHRDDLPALTEEWRRLEDALGPAGHRTT